MQKLMSSLALGAVLALGGNYLVGQSGDAAPPPPAEGGRIGHGGMDPAAMAAHLARRLDLSSDQETQVQTILASQQTQSKSLDANQSITHQQFLAQSKALHDQTETKIEALLNDTQKAEFEKMKSHMGHGPRPDGEAPPPPPQ